MIITPARDPAIFSAETKQSLYIIEYHSNKGDLYVQEKHVWHFFATDTGGFQRRDD